MRSFLAIELPENIRTELVRLAQVLAESGADVKWVRQEHIHLTLRFFGEISEEQKNSIESILKNIAGSAFAFEASLSQAGAFPNANSPRVVWVGVGQGAEKISHLAKKLEEDFSSIGIIPEEKSFVPHITLGRVRTSKKKDMLASRLKSTDWNPPAPFLIDKLTLFQSTLTSSGPTYTRLSNWPLAKQS